MVFDLYESRGKYILFPRIYISFFSFPLIRKQKKQKEKTKTPDSYKKSGKKNNKKNKPPFFDLYNPYRLVLERGFFYTYFILIGICFRSLTYTTLMWLYVLLSVI